MEAQSFTSGGEKEAARVRREDWGERCKHIELERCRRGHTHGVRPAYLLEMHQWRLKKKERTKQNKNATYFQQNVGKPNHEVGRLKK